MGGEGSQGQGAEAERTRSYQTETMTLIFLRETKSGQNTGPQEGQGIHFTLDTGKGLMPSVVTPLPEMTRVRFWGDFLGMNDGVCSSPNPRLGMWFTLHRSDTDEYVTG